MAMDLDVNVNAVSWPSLYDPAIELSINHNPVQPGGSYLLHPNGGSPHCPTSPLANAYRSYKIYSDSLFIGLLYSTFLSMPSVVPTPSSILPFHLPVDRSPPSLSERLPTISSPPIQIKRNNGSSVHDKMSAVPDSPLPSSSFLHFSSLVSPVLSSEQQSSASYLQVSTRRAAFTCQRASSCFLAAKSQLTTSVVGFHLYGR